MSNMQPQKVILTVIATATATAKNENENDNNSNTNSHVNYLPIVTVGYTVTFYLPFIDNSPTHSTPFAYL